MDADAAEEMLKDKMQKEKETDNNNNVRDKLKPFIIRLGSSPDHVTYSVFEEEGVIHYRIALNSIREYTLPALIMSFSNLATLITAEGKTINKSEAFLGHTTYQAIKTAKKYCQVVIGSNSALHQAQLVQPPHQGKRQRSMSGSSVPVAIQASCNWRNGKCGCLIFKPTVKDQTICDNCSHKIGFHAL
jgi:hypothetical protein